MGLEELSHVVVPSVQGTMPTLPPTKAAHLGTICAEKGSTVLNGIRYSLQWVSDSVQSLTPSQQTGLILVEKGLKEGGAIETLVAGATNLARAVEEMPKLSSKILSWWRGTPKDDAEQTATKARDVAYTMIDATCSTVQKFDNFLYAMEAFDLSKVPFTQVFHGFGYAASAYAAGKNVIEARNALKELEAGIKSEKEVYRPGAYVKISKNIAGFAMAVIGFLALLFNSAKLSFAYLGFCCVNIGLSLTEHITSIGKTRDQLEAEALEKQYGSSKPIRIYV